MTSGWAWRQVGVLAAMVALATACQEPFGADRHHLEGWRIAAVQATPAGGLPGDEVTARAVVVVDDALWRTEDATLHWFWDEDDRVADFDPAVDPIDHTGNVAVLTLPEGDGETARLAVVLADDQGVVYRAWLDLPVTGARDALPVEVPDLARVSVPETFDAQDVSAREAWETAAGNPGSGELARLTVDLPDDVRSRWMTVGHAGTFWELTHASTDWWAADVVFDDEDALVGAATPAGPVTGVVLALDDAGAVGWRSWDFFVGGTRPGLVTTGGRWLSSSLTGEGTVWVQAELAADDTAPTGLALVDPVVRDALDTADPYGTQALDCTDVSGPFEPGWLVDGRCTREAVTGAVVVLEGTL